MKRLLFLLGLSTAALFACAGGPPPVCEEVRTCCETLDPAVAGSCRESFERAVALDLEAAEHQCRSALAGFRAAGFCGESNRGDAGAEPDGGGTADVTVLPNLPPSQGLSQPCDPAHGVDACGAGLFCAAFDGRTIPTCYPEGVRQSGETCAENRHCLTASCNPSPLRCRAGDGEPCEEAVGCASGNAYCSAQSSSCQRVGDGREGAACGGDTHCEAGLRCQGEACRPTRLEGSPCIGNSGCDGGLVCIGGRCAWDGGEGAACETTQHCDAGLVCEARRCTRPAGGACQIAASECRAGEYCQLTSVSPEAAMCMPEGPAARGELCHPGRACSGGTTCLAFAEVDGRCFTPCDSEAGEGCAPGWDCLPMRTLSFGICLALSCTPFSCGAGQVCDQTFDLERQELLGCVPSGQAPIGASCESTRCAAPGFCVDLGPGPRCQTPCDQARPCASGTCIYLGGTEFGVCE